LQQYFFITATRAASASSRALFAAAGVAAAAAASSWAWMLFLSASLNGGQSDVIGLRRTCGVAFGCVKGGCDCATGVVGAPSTSARLCSSITAAIVKP